MDHKMMNVEQLTTLAMAPPPGPDGQQASGGQLHFFVMMAIMIAIFYVVLIRPQRRREQERREMLGKVSTGDQVMFGGGILGTISNVKEKTFVIRIADKVKVEVSRGAVTNVVGKDEAPPDPQER